MGGGEGARAREAGVAKRAEFFHDFLTSVLFCFYLWTNMSRETARLQALPSSHDHLVLPSSIKISIKESNHWLPQFSFVSLMLTHRVQIQYKPSGWINRFSHWPWPRRKTPPRENRKYRKGMYVEQGRAERKKFLSSKWGESSRRSDHNKLDNYERLWGTLEAWVRLRIGTGTEGKGGFHGEARPERGGKPRGPKNCEP